ncbi:MAG: hypothetical protein QXX12_02795 [Nanopusillaceae archaeon]
MREEAIPLDNLFEELRPTTPKVVYNTNIDIDYRRKKMIIKDKGRKWVVIVERAGKNLRIDYLVNKDPSKDLPDPEDFDYESYEIKNPLDILGLSLPEDVKSAVGLALSNWDKELRKVEAAIALREVSIMPSSITDREYLTSEVVKMLVKKYNMARIKLKDNDKIIDYGYRCYESKYWAPCEDMVEKWISEALHDIQKVKFGKSALDDVLTKLSIYNTIILKGYTPLISFDNYVLDIESFLLTGDLRASIKQHSKDLYVFHHIPHQLNLDLLEEIRKGLEVYIPPKKPEEILTIVKSMSPRFYELLRDITYFEGVDPKIHESRILFMLEMIGRGLVPGYTLNNTIIEHFKDIFVLVGRKGTGKSTFLRQVLGDTILSEANYELVDLGKLGSGDPDEVEKALGKLARKNPLVAMHLDLSKRSRIYNWEKIRQASGGDPVPARRLYRDSFDYKPHWKLYISTNDPPPVNEEGSAREALLGRFRVIEVKNKKVREKPLPKLDEKDVEVAIIASLYAIKRVYDTGEYSFTGISDIEDALNRYTYPEYNIVMEMLETGRLKLDKNLEISSSDLYQECMAYANEVKTKYGEEDEEEIERLYSLPNQTEFTKRLKKLLAKYKVKTVSHHHYTYFKGVGLAKTDQHKTIFSM